MDDDESDDELWPGYVGVSVHVPQEFYRRDAILTEVGKRPLGPTARAAREAAWLKDLQAHAQRFVPTARAVLQPLATDFLGFDDRYACLWHDTPLNGGGAEVEIDIVAYRGFLEAEGYHVSSITYHYDPPMA